MRGPKGSRRRQVGDPHGPSTGRFFTEDPIKDGVNWYTYVYNDPVNFVDPLRLDGVDVQLAGRGYREGVTPFRYNQLDYGMVEGLGITSSYTVVGYVSIDRNENESFSATVFAVGYSVGANQAGNVHFSGEVRITSDEEVLHSVVFRRPEAPSITDPQSQIIGEAKFLLPPENVEIEFEVGMMVTYNLQMGGSIYSPIPMRRELPIFADDE